MQRFPRGGCWRRSCSVLKCPGPPSEIPRMHHVPTTRPRSLVGTPDLGAHGVLATTRRRILVVDDDASVLGLLRALLDTLEDVDVDTCADPETALRRIREGGYDLVISDERMPKKSGL